MMNEQDLMKLWQASSDEKNINVDLNQLTMNLKNRVNKVDRRIKRRDSKEIIGCLIGIAFHVYLLIDIPYLLPKIACLILIFWFGYVIFRLKSASKIDDPDFLVPLREQLRLKKSFLTKQMRMLDSVLYWYIIPPFIANLLFFFGMGEPNAVEWNSPLSGLLDFSFRTKIINTAFVALLYAYIYSQNRKAAKVNYAPLIKEIDQLETEYKE